MLAYSRPSDSSFYIFSIRLCGNVIAVMVFQCNSQPKIVHTLSASTLTSAWQRQQAIREVGVQTISACTEGALCGGCRGPAAVCCRRAATLSPPLNVTTLGAAKHTCINTTALQTFFAGGRRWYYLSDTCCTSLCKSSNFNRNPLQPLVLLCTGSVTEA